MAQQIKYTVGCLRNAGLNARWSRTRHGAPILTAKTDSGIWAVIDAKMWDRAKQVGIKQAFEEHTTFIEFFSIRR